MAATKIPRVEYERCYFPRGSTYVNKVKYNGHWYTISELASHLHRREDCIARCIREGMPIGAPTGVGKTFNADRKLLQNFILGHYAAREQAPEGLKIASVL